MYITRKLHIDESELQVRFIRASGPGGQHVNKAATAVQLRFDAAQSPSLPDDVRQRLLAMRTPNMTDGGVVRIHADKYRSQARNRENARKRLADLVSRAARSPAKRRPTRVPRRAKRQRLNNKKKRSYTKQLRGKPPLE